MESKVKKVIYFVRHGQSNDNALPVFQSTDSPLSKNGQAQAKQIANRVSKLSFDSLISSPLLRAKETAEAISQAAGKEIEVSSLLVERIKPKTINGKSWDDPKASAVWREWEKSLFTPGLRIEDGENYDDIVKRAELALDYLLNLPEQTLVVVTHGYFLRTIIARVLLGNELNGDIFKRFQSLASMDNTGISVLQYADAFEEDFCWRLLTYNDHSHFAE